MQPTIIARPAFTVVGLAIRTQPKSPEIAQLWQRFGPRMAEVPHAAEQYVSYGLMDHFDRTAGQLEYLAGVAVAQVTDLLPEMTRWEVPANTYAVLDATLPTISQTFDYLFGTWLPISGYQQLAAPYFERYGETFDPTDPTSTLQIYLPIAPAA